MNIQHRPIFDREKIIEHYSGKDGVPVKYVCTSALGDEARAMDIFYRNTPHPEFGNRYFGLYFRSTGPLDEQRQLCITNADRIEDLTFDMIEVNGQWHYSQHRHDFHSVGDVAIDGGRAYIRLVGDINVPRATLKVVNGQFEKVVEDVTV
jgi:hypothetical protein